MAALAKVSIVLLLFAQAYCCAALISQQTARVKNHLHRSKNSEAPTDRRIRKLLGEATEGADEMRVSQGLRGSLIRSTYMAKTEKLTAFEKIHHDMEMSKNRAAYLFGRVRKTTNDPIKKRKLLNGFVSSIPVSSIPGDYSMEIFIGTPDPPQTIRGVVDTSSDLVWVQCAQCTSCSQDIAKFDSGFSSSYIQLGCDDARCNELGNRKLSCDPGCQYTYAYRDDSTTVGDFSSETISIADRAGVLLQVTNFLFGCVLQNTGIYTDTSGLIGLGRGPFSFLSQIAPHLNNVNKFSYCFVLSMHANVASTILFGENAVPTGNFSTTPLLSPANSTSTLYYVNLTDISVGGSPSSIPSSSFQIDPTTGDGGVIFDSGTTYTMLEPVAYQRVVSAFSSSMQAHHYDVVNTMGPGLDACYSVPNFEDQVMENIPTLTFNFEGADLNLAIENYVQGFTDDSGNNYICLVLTKGSVGHPSIIGTTMQQNFQVLYDLDNEVIGWVQTDCTKL